MKLYAKIPSRFQWHIENLSQELGLGPRLFRAFGSENTQVWRLYVANIKVYGRMLMNELIFLIFFFNKHI